MSSKTKRCSKNHWLPVRELTFSITFFLFAVKSLCNLNNTNDNTERYFVYSENVFIKQDFTQRKSLIRSGSGYLGRPEPGCFAAQNCRLAPYQDPPSRNFYNSSDLTTIGYITSSSSIAIRDRYRTFSSDHRFLLNKTLHKFPPDGRD